MKDVSSLAGNGMSSPFYLGWETGRDKQLEVPKLFSISASVALSTLSSFKGLLGSVTLQDRPGEVIMVQPP